MPSVESFDCVDDAVLWEYDGVNEFNVVRVKAPVEIKVRWNDDVTDGKDSQGTKISIAVQIAALREIPMNSILRHGLIADVPDPKTELVQIVGNKIGGKDVQGKESRYLFQAARFMDQVVLS